MEANWKLFGQTYETEYQLARRRTYLKIDLDQLLKNVNILKKLCSDQTGKLYFSVILFPYHNDSKVRRKLLVESSIGTKRDKDNYVAKTRFIAHIAYW